MTSNIVLAQNLCTFSTAIYKNFNAPHISLKVMKFKRSQSLKTRVSHQTLRICRKKLATTLR